jgi:hypothetical protein
LGQYEITDHVVQFVWTRRIHHGLQIRRCFRKCRFEGERITASAIENMRGNENNLRTDIANCEINHGVDTDP